MSRDQCLLCSRGGDLQWGTCQPIPTNCTTKAGLECGDDGCGAPVDVRRGLSPVGGARDLYPGAVLREEESPAAGTQTVQATCLEECGWSAWSVVECSNQGVCTPGELDTGTGGACGGCGVETTERTCNSNCEWGEWVVTGCNADGECTPGEEDSQTVPCGQCGTAEQVRTCTNACVWGPPELGTCSGQGECVAGSVENGPGLECGLCGEASQVRVCSSECAWGPLSGRRMQR